MTYWLKINKTKLGKGSEKKPEKLWGGGVSKKRKKANLYFGKVFFRSLSGTNKHYLLRGLPFWLLPLGEPPEQFFGKSWEFGPTDLTPLPERWDFFRKFVGNFWQKRVKYAIKTVIYKSWDWVRPPPPLLGQIPNFYRKFVLGAPLIACQQSRIPNSLLIALGPHFEISEPK